MRHWLQITSGRGPEECCLVVAKVLHCIIKEGTEHNLEISVLDTVPGDKPHTLKSALLAVEGEGSSEFVRQWTGTVQWIGKSPFRPHHKRKNWFVGVESLNPPEPHLWSEKDVKIETMRASGPGGQHVNKTETAVRITHLCTGLTAIAREERSQHLNRKLAEIRLGELIRQKKDQTNQKHLQERWSQHNRLERGNPIRVYEDGLSP